MGPIRLPPHSASASAGFTIMETVVTAAIVAVVLSSTIGVLFRYTDTDVQSQKTLRAQHLAQAEVDEVLAHHAIENSLVSDTQGRARYYPIPDLGYLVSQYYFNNFPINFPGNTIPFNHDAVGSLDPVNGETLFRANQSRTVTGAPTVGNQATYTLRFQLLGLDDKVSSSDLNLLIQMTENPTNGLYNHHYWVPGTTTTTDATGSNAFNPLIGDSSPSVSLNVGRWFTDTTSPRKNMRRYTLQYQGHVNFISKVLIVRVYGRDNPRRELGHAYGVFTGRVQL